MTRRRLSSFALLSFVLVFLGASASGQSRFSRPDGAPEVGAEAPKVKATTPDGKVVDLSKPSRIAVLVFGSHT